MCVCVANNNSSSFRFNCSYIYNISVCWSYFYITIEVNIYIFKALPLLTNIVITTSVTFMAPVSKNTARSDDTFRPCIGDHSPTFTMACGLNFTRSSLKPVRRPSLNSTGPVSPFHSAYKGEIYERKYIFFCACNLRAK